MGETETPFEGLSRLFQCGAERGVPGLVAPRGKTDMDVVGHVVQFAEELLYQQVVLFVLPIAIDRITFVLLLHIGREITLVADHRIKAEVLP